MRLSVIGIVATGLVMAGGLQAQDLLGVPDPFTFSLQAPNPPSPPARVQLFTNASGSYLGVGVVEIDAEKVKSLKLKEERGVEITRVDDNSPAAKAGLKVGDVVLEYNGQRVEGTQQFVRMVQETPEGRQARLAISRDGGSQTVTATIGKREGASFMMGQPFDNERLRAELDKARKAAEDAQARVRLPFGMPDVPQVIPGYSSSVLGVVAETLSPQLAEYFGVKEGVLVRSVTENSAAAKAGFKAGDVITKVDATSVTTPQEITRALRTAREKKTFPVAVTRNHKEMALSVTLEQEPSRVPAARPVNAL